MKESKTLLLILPSLFHSVEESVSLGVSAGLGDAPINIIRMAIGWMSPGQVAQFSRIHKTIGLAELDGIIMYGATIHHEAAVELVGILEQYYPNVPVLNIGDIIEQTPSVILDNRTIFTELVDHLVVDKECKNIAFLNGPEDNFDAMERRDAVVSALAKRGLAIPDQLHWQGQYSFASGNDAVRKYFNKYSLLPDAIICANDYMALGVIDELIRLGYRVPQDILVTGFDNLENSKLIKVPLTTGQYPIFEMAVLAAKLMKSWLNGQEPALVNRQSTKAIFRKSTGETREAVSIAHSAGKLQPRVYARDANSDRLGLSREINRLNESGENINKISEGLASLGGYQCYFFRCDKHLKMRKVFHLRGQHFDVFSSDNCPFLPLDSGKVLQDRVFEDSHWVMAPVGLEEYYFGHILMELRAEDSDLAEFFANELCKRLENLVLANSAEKMRLQVLETEKMASLGRLVSGLAHEINTPIGTGLVAASNIADEIRVIQNLINESKLTKSAFVEFVGNINENQQVLYSSLKRTADLVSSFKKVSVDTELDELQTIRLDEYIQEVIASLKPRIKRANIAVELQIEPNIELKTFPGTWAQITTNLLLNAFIHGFDVPLPEAKVTIELHRKKQSIQLTVSDNGKGIEPENQKLIFDPFFTTKRNQGGTGLGLNIVFNMVTQKLKGRIHVESHTTDVAGKRGTKFVVTVPITDYSGNKLN